MIKFSNDNRKINALAKSLNLKKNQVVSFDLPAGHTCPAASLCKSQAHVITGKITDGEKMIFRCYAASTESCFTSVRKLRWDNFGALRESSDMSQLILTSIPKSVKIIRVHSSGDFFNKEYFQAWIKVAIARPDITIFGYTKILPYVTAKKPANFKLVYSIGGKFDKFFTNEPACFVVTSSDNLPAPLACINESSDDYGRILSGESFSLMVHGTQPAKVKPKNKLYATLSVGELSYSN